MSGPLEQAGVEDVLSSIRRLVSEDNRKTRPSGGARRPEGLRPRLVLTPALRVPPTTDLEPAAAEDDDLHLEDADSDDLDTVEAAQGGADADLGQEGASDAAVAPQDPKPTFLGGADTVEHAASLDMFRLNKTVSEDIESAEETSEDEVLPWKDPEATLYSASEIVTGDETADDEAVDTADDDAVDKNVMVEAVHQVEPEPMPDTAEVTHLHNASARQRAAAVVRKIAEMEAATAQSATSSPQWEPDASQNGPFASETMTSASNDWDAPERVDSAETVDRPAASQQVDADDIAAQLTADVIDATAEDVSADIAENTLDDLDDATLIDEDMLRDLVVEIVRKELQGSLGEKITRNVRKLVRREIQRALAAHDIL
ncbi:hypothetical protein KMP13_01720 [Epibacterium ulvae]|uniref:hypothetical protein n=1 Tax=Epibacterium ulvae TaxID=1156985 RepID=UPI001BFC61D7|nr:hypothetical protein [Epibacterium ulvae]MBT8152634.1 hypothetical protein [Epibacterium ulvae]